MIVAMGRRPDEEIRAGRWGADDQVGIADVMREEVKAHHTVLPRRYTAILDIVRIRAKRLHRNREVSDNRHQIRAHFLFLAVIKAVDAAPFPFSSQLVLSRKEPREDWRIAQPSPAHV